MAYPTALALFAALVLASGVFEHWLAPLPPSDALHGEGRETEDTAESLPVETMASREQRVWDTRGKLFGSFAALAGAASTPKVMYSAASDAVECDDLVATASSDGQPSTWTKRQAVKYFVVHSAGVESDVSGLSVARYHHETLGWEHAGYTAVIRQSGKCEQLLPSGTMDYAAFHYNPIGFHVMLSGLQNFTPAQLATLRRLWLNVAVQYGLQPDAAVGHRTLSQWDARDRDAGVWRQHYNDHVDPCVSTAGCEFDLNRFGLSDALRAYQQRGGPTPPASPLAVQYPGPRPVQPRDGDGPVIGQTFTSSLTWYGNKEEGNPMRCRETPGPEASGQWPRYRKADSKHLTAVYVYAVDGLPPAWPCGTWLRVWANGRSVDVKVTDTGGFRTDRPVAGHYLDLGELASAWLTRGAPATINGAKVEVISFDDGFCRYVAESDHRVCGDFRPTYFKAKGGGWNTYGPPLEDANYARWEGEGLVTQRFEKGTFNYQAGKVWITK